MKIEIKHRWTEAVLFTADVPDDMASGMHMRHALEKATAARAYLDGAYLAGANLAGAYLAGANLAGAYLAGANLAGAYLAGANLAGANLAGAYLAGAYLAGAYLAGANLAGAYLAGAYLAGANLAGANLDGAYLDGKKLIGKRPVFQIGPIGSRCANVVFVLTDAGMMVQAGCFFGTRAEFEDALAEEHGDNEHAQEYRAALALADVHAKLWAPADEAAQPAPEAV